MNVFSSSTLSQKPFPEISPTSARCVLRTDRDARVRADGMASLGMPLFVHVGGMTRTRISSAFSRQCRRSSQRNEDAPGARRDIRGRLLGESGTAKDVHCSHAPALARCPLYGSHSRFDPRRASEDVGGARFPVLWQGSDGRGRGHVVRYTSAASSRGNYRKSWVRPGCRWSRRSRCDGKLHHRFPPGPRAARMLAVNALAESRRLSWSRAGTLAEACSGVATRMHFAVDDFQSMIS